MMSKHYFHHIFLPMIYQLYGIISTVNAKKGFQCHDNQNRNFSEISKGSRRGKNSVSKHGQQQVFGFAFRSQGTADTKQKKKIIPIIYQHPIHHMEPCQEKDTVHLL